MRWWPFRRRPDRVSVSIEELIKPPRYVYTKADERLPQRAAQRRLEAEVKQREAQQIRSGIERPRMYRKQVG